MSIVRLASVSPVIQSLVVVAFGVGVVFLAAWFAQRWSPRPLWRRMFWRAALVVAVAWIVAEVVGGNMMVARWMSFATDSVAQIEREVQPPATDDRSYEFTASVPVSFEPLPSEESTWEGPLETPPYEPHEWIVELSTDVVYDNAALRGRDSFSPPDPTAQNTLSAKKNPDPVHDDGLFLFALLAGSVLLTLWFIGRRIVVVWFTWRHTSPATSSMATLVSSHLAQRDEASSRGARRLRVVESRRLSAPVVYGVWQPTLAVPVGFAQSLPPDQLHAVLAHELVHVSGRDPLWQVVFDAVVTLAWWHPLVWLARAKHRAACEAAADAGAAATEGGPRALAAALVRLARHAATGPRLGWAALESGGKRRSRLGRRVLRLLREDPASAPSTLGRSGKLLTTVVVGLLVVSLLFGTALARCSVSDRTFVSGENPMTIWQTSWRTSLAAAAVATMLGTSYADETEEVEEIVEAELALELEVEADETGAEIDDPLELLVELQSEVEAELVLADDEMEQAQAERVKALEAARMKELMMLPWAKAKQVAQAQAQRQEAIIAQEMFIVQKKLAEAQAQIARDHEQLQKRIRELVKEAEVAASQGRLESAQEIMEQVRQIQQQGPRDRIRMVQQTINSGDKVREFANDAERRRHHLVQAATNLSAVGKNELAEELMQEAESIVADSQRRESASRFGNRAESFWGGADAKLREARRVEAEIRSRAALEDDRRALNLTRRREAEERERRNNNDDLRAEMNELKSQINDMQQMLKDVVGRLEIEKEREIR